MTKNIEILFGDDQFADIQTKCIFEGDYTRRLKDQFPDLRFNWNCQEDYQATIDEAKTGRYDVVVTDLQYTTNGCEGYDVVKAVSKVIPKPIIILCTNSKVESWTERGIDFVAKPEKGFYHKFDALIKVLADYYKSRGES
jgi:hypothetical protein